MLEYMFFDESLRGKFVEFVRGKGIDCQTDDTMGLVAQVPEDIPEDVSDEIDDFYDVVLQENAELLEEGEDALLINNAGVQVLLADGNPCMIRFDPKLMGKILGCLTMEELRDMVQAIADKVANPDDRPLCHV